MNTIDQFMWGYQPHFRASVSMLVGAVLKQINAGVSAQVFLVGVARPDRVVRHVVCVEPEDGQLPQSLFQGVGDEIERAIPIDQQQSVFFGDEPSMRDKPENIRRSVTRETIARHLAGYDQDNSTKSYCGSVYPVDDYYVCPIIQIPASIFVRHPAIDLPEVDRWTAIRLSFIETCIEVVLGEARDALVFPEPGRQIFDAMRSAAEVVARAASRFMLSVSSRLGGLERPDLFSAFNAIAALKYEGADVEGRLVLADLEKFPPDYLLKLSKPVRVTEVRWARKLLQLATRATALAANATGLYGVVSEQETFSGSPDVFTVEFPADRQWTLAYKSQQLLRVEAGQAQLPFEAMSRERFDDQVGRIFAASPDLDKDALWRLFQTTQRLPRGHMVMIAADAGAEAQRLALQGTQIEPVKVSEALIDRACRIDGTIIVDPAGRCHAIGVILDGIAQADCTPSRGARFNSAIRYVAAEPGRMAIVVSDDATIDVIPLLRPRVSAAKIEENLAAFEAATRENYHASRHFLDEHRFYLSAAQCARANAAIVRLDRLPYESKVIYIGTAKFAPNPAMNDTYLS